MQRRGQVKKSCHGVGWWQREMLWRSARPDFASLQDWGPSGWELFLWPQEISSSPASLWKLKVKVGCLGLPSWKNGKEAQSRFSFCKWDFWSCIFDVKIVIWKYLFPLCFAFCQIQYHWDPNEHDLASCQTKHIPAKCLIMEMNMWWESFLCMFHGNKLLMKLQKQSFLPCSLNLNT